MTDPAEEPTGAQARPPARADAPAAPRWLRILPVRTLLALLVLGLAPFLLHGLGLIKLPVSFLTTKGTIYVDSPEVYTRERLVNDRYDQDYWLRRQLELLDSVEREALISRDTARSLSAAVGSAAADDPTPPATDADAADDAPADARAEPGRGLTFEQRFRVLSGLRDMIRQLILENMLDDRHDLTGNSVYGLKFDTTVIPGDNTRQRAYVKVRLEPDTLFAPPTVDGTDDASRPHLQDFFRQSCRETRARLRLDPAPCEAATAPDSNTQATIDRLGKYYRAWLTDIQKRLNATEDSLFESMNDCDGKPAEDQDPRGFYDKLTRTTLRVVLGIPDERFTKNNPSRGPAKTSPSSVIRLPDPWGRFMQIYREPLDDPTLATCAPRVWFDVSPLNERLSAMPAETDADPCWAWPEGRMGPPLDFRTAPLVQSGDWTLGVPTWTYPDRMKMFEEPGLKYTPSPVALGRIAALAYPPADDAAGEVELEVEVGAASGLHEREPLCLALPSGFLNFVDQMSRLDAYAYAVFPKNDVIGVLRQGETRVGGGNDSGMVGFAQRLAESDTQSVLVGFGDARPDPTAARAVHFGWVISPVDTLEPVLKTQLALVSVPAWTSTLKFEIETGWVDEDGQPVPSEAGAFPMTIRVPPDFEAFDSIIRGDAGVSRGPRIQDDAMDKRIHVVAGRPARILIPGTRLWRSASVTLGPQTAERIRVLPNMEGIVAEFERVDLPYAQFAPRPDERVTDAAPNAQCRLKDEALAALRARPVRLRVWTSEGVATALKPVCVIYDPNAHAEAASELQRTVVPSTPSQ